MNRAAIRAELQSRKRAHASRLTLDRHAPIPLLAPCAAPGCGLLCIPVEVRTATVWCGLVITRRNLRPRCAEHAGWLAGDESLAGNPTAAGSHGPREGLEANKQGDSATVAPGHASSAERVEGPRSTAPLAYVAALCLLAWIAAALLKASHESGDRARWEQVQ